MSCDPKQPAPKQESTKPHYVLVVHNAKHAPKLTSTQEKQNG